MPHPASSRPRTRGHQVNGFQLIALLLAFVLVAGVGGVLAAGLFIPAAASMKAVTDTSQSVFDDLPTDLDVGKLPQASTVYASDGKTVIARFYDENRTVVPLDKISLPMQHAMVDVEDKRFYEHGGIDVTGTIRALVNNASGNETQGASTLTQQYVKNILIENALAKGDAQGVMDARALTVERKLREAKLAISLEQKVSKDDILAGYLNIAQFGSRVYGVEAAAQYYFSTSAAKLTALQAATIAGITQSPSAYDPTLHPGDSQRKRNVVLFDMYQQGDITKAQYDKYRVTPIKKTLKVSTTSITNGCAAGKDTSLFCDYITTVIKNNDDDAFSSWGKTASARMTTFLRGGYNIVTTLDAKAQQDAQTQVSAGVPVSKKLSVTHNALKDSDPKVKLQLEAAIVSVTPGTGEIRAMAQNRPFDASSASKIYGSTSVNYTTDYAHGGSGGFQPGSSFKPYVLADWLQTGHSLYQSVSGDKGVFPMSDFHSSCGGFTRYGVPNWPVGNSENGALGSISVQKATTESVNRAYAAMATQLDLCQVGKTATALGWTPIGWTPTYKDTQTSIHITPSMILGSQVTSPLSQATAYATFASGGTRCDPIAITSITDAKGKQVAVPNAHCDSDAIDPKIAATVTYALHGPLESNVGTATGNTLTGGRDAAGKTGTANASQETWFVGYTPQLSTAVWVGNAEYPIGLHNITVAKSKFVTSEVPWLYGGTLAAPIWKAYMDDALKGQPNESFDAPDTSLVNKPAPPKAPADSGSSDNSGSDKSGSGDNGGDSDKSGDSNSGGSQNGGGSDSSGSDTSGATSGSTGGSDKSSSGTSSGSTGGSTGGSHKHGGKN